MKKIAHINFAKSYRGGERQTELLIKELSKFGYKQKVVLRKNSKLSSRLNGIENVEIIEIGKPYFLYINKIKDCNIIHAHETKGTQFALMANLFFKTPYIVTRRVIFPIKKIWFNRLLYKRAYRVVVLSTAIKEEILKSFKLSNIEIIPSSYDDAVANEKLVKNIKEHFKNKFLIGNIGALVDSDKGQTLIIKAAKELQKYKDIHFLFVGSGKDEKLFKDMAKDLTNVTFIGFVDNVVDYVKALDLFLFPSKAEGLGSILLDVMKNEVPIIASNVGGIPDIIKHRHNGLLVNLEVYDIVDAILKLYKDKELRIKLKKSALEDIENYSAKNMARRYIEIYEHCDAPKKSNKCKS